MFKLFAATIAALLVATSAAPKPHIQAVPLAYSSPLVSAYGAGPVVSAYSAPLPYGEVSSPYVASPYGASPLAYSAYNPVAYLG